jgi:hypothetical protein
MPKTPITDDLLKLYGFSITNDSFDGALDEFERDGFIISYVYGNVYSYGAGSKKRNLESIEELQALWKEKMRIELNMIV